MPLMKTIHCPKCRNPFRVEAEFLEPVQQDRGRGFAWLTSVCEKCFVTYEIYGDPKSTSTRLKT